MPCMYHDRNSMYSTVQGLVSQAEEEDEVTTPLRKGYNNVDMFQSPVLPFASSQPLPTLPFCPL